MTSIGKTIITVLYTIAALSFIMILMTAHTPPSASTVVILDVYHDDAHEGWATLIACTQDHSTRTLLYGRYGVEGDTLTTDAIQCEVTE